MFHFNMFWLGWLVLIAVLTLGCWPTGNISSSTYQRDVLSSGVVIPAGPPASVGKRAQPAQVVVAANTQRSFGSSDFTRTRRDGASGNVLAIQQAQAYLGFGLNSWAELGFSGRYVGADWPRSGQASGLDSKRLEDAFVLGTGVLLRSGLMDTERFSLNLDSELELLQLPYARTITGTVTTSTNCGFFGCNSEDPRSTNLRTDNDEGTEVFMIPRLGLSASFDLGIGFFLQGGVHFQALPQFKGHHFEEDSCADNCREVTDKDDIDIHEFVGFATLQGGLGLVVSEYLEVVGTVHTSTSLENNQTNGGLETPGGLVSARLIFGP